MALGERLGNIGGGALAGAGAGSAFGPFGAAGGGLLGALLGAFGKSGKKSGNDIPGYDKYSSFNPQQQAIFEQLVASLQGKLGGELDPARAAPYLRQFEEKTIPGLAEKFAGLGAGSQSSSGFQQALGSSAADLSERLASMQSGEQSNIINQLMQLLGLSTESLTQQQTPWWQSFLGGAAPALGKALGSSIGGQFGQKKTPQQGSFINPATGQLTGGTF